MPFFSESTKTYDHRNVGYFMYLKLKLFDRLPQNNKGRDTNNRTAERK